MYFAGKLVYLIVLPSDQLAINASGIYVACASQSGTKGSLQVCRPSVSHTFLSVDFLASRDVCPRS